MNTMNANPGLNQETRVIHEVRVQPVKRRQKSSAFIHAAAFVLTVGGTVLKIIGKGIILTGRLLKPKKRSGL
ncbi:MAG: hypothetical protein EOO02_10805 [Chitinophagaceae bacterium]|nr:MAG: hypothetical protein EOO02_10805 [Chitinophagaceae bacterium]